MQKIVYLTTGHMNRTLLWRIEVKVERLNQLKTSKIQKTSQCRKLEILNLLFSIWLMLRRIQSSLQIKMSLKLKHLTVEHFCSELVPSIQNLPASLHGNLAIHTFSSIRFFDWGLTVLNRIFEPLFN